MSVLADGFLATACQLNHSSLLQIQDCSIIEGKLHEYRRAFDAIDSSGDGTLNGSEITQLFRSLGQPLQPSKLAKLMEAVDRNTDGRVDFFEFLGIFRQELLDLNKIEGFVKMRLADPARSRSHKLVEVGLQSIVYQVLQRPLSDCLLPKIASSMRARAQAELQPLPFVR